MTHEPAPFRPEVPKLPTDATDAEFDAWMSAPLPCPGIGFSDDQDDMSDADIDSEIVAGSTVPHAIVAEWLKTWGKPGRLPFDEWFAARNG